MKNFIYLSILAVLLVGAVKYWSPADAPISGVTPDDIAASVAERVESTHENVIVNSNVVQPDEASNAVVVQYVIVMNVDPLLFSSQAQTQAEAVEQQAAFTSLTGSIADALALSQQYLLVNPTVAQVRITIIFLDGQVGGGTVSSTDLAAIPPESTVEEWMSVIPLAPAAVIPQNIWEALLADPAVQKVIEQFSNQQG